MELSEDSGGTGVGGRGRGMEGGQGGKGLYRKVCKDVWIDLFDLGLIMVGVVFGGMEGEFDGWLGFGFRDLLYDLDKKKGLDLGWGSNSGEGDEGACKGCL